jgi:serine protein kinase
MKWIDVVNDQEQKQISMMSFDEFLNMVEKKPQTHLRTSCLYLKDMFDHFGKTKNGGFALFTREHADAPSVKGQISAQHRLYQNLKNFSEEGYNNKFLLLIGPNGSAKSSMVRKIMYSAEDYSNTEEGALYSFSWIYPIDQFVKGSLGLGGTSPERNISTYAYLDDKEISAIMPSELKDHPILLLPLKARQKLIEQMLKNDPDRLEVIKKSYLYQGDLSQRNRVIFDALLKNYKGNYQDVMKHIRIERFHINRRYGFGATTIEPQMHVDAHMQQITMDKRLANLPPSLQSLNLFSMNGEVVLANRGILEFSDLLKRPLDTFKYLLMTMETKNINLSGILTELDIFFIGSSNEIHFSAFKQHPDFNSFKGRFNFIRVPYLLNYLDEMPIYKEQLDNLKDKAVFEPHALEALCLWSVSTRLRAPNFRNYNEERLGKIAEALNPLEKSFFYAKESAPEYMDSESKQILRTGIGEIAKEFENDGLYEGKFGISPREVKQIIYDLSEHHQSVSFIEVLDYLKDLSDKKNEFDFLNITPQGDYHHSKRCLDLIQSYSLDTLDSEVRESLGLIDDRSYEDYLSKYILNINAQIKGEKIKNNVTGKFEVSDLYFVKEFESNIFLNEAPEKFRSSLIARLGAYSLDNPGKPISYAVIFEDLVRLLQESFRKEQKKTIDKVSKNLVLYLAETREDKSSTLSKENREMIENITNNLVKKFNYSFNGAINLLQSLLKKRYDDATL